MNTEQLIENTYSGKKRKWDDEFDRIQHLSVNDVVQCWMNTLNVFYLMLAHVYLLRSGKWRECLW